MDLRVFIISRMYPMHNVLFTEFSAQSKVFPTMFNITYGLDN